jgi:polyisoprenoid-binding protein YceI
MRRALSIAVGLALLPLAAYAEPRTYKLDPEHTTLALLVDHLGYARTLGRFTAVEGSFVYDEATRTLSKLRVAVATASFASDNAARDEHVRNKDFLNVTAFPQMVFAADGGTPTGPNRGTVTGDLTLLGQTRPLTLDVTLNKAEAYPFGHGRHTLGISARGQVSRSEFGMTYGVAAGMVGDTVDIIIEIEAIRQD